MVGGKERGAGRGLMGPVDAFGRARCAGDRATATNEKKKKKNFRATCALLSGD